MFEKDALLPTERVEVPWTWLQTIFGALLTLVPWIALSLTLATSQSSHTHITHLKPAQDLANAIITFVVSSLIEAAFLIAPLYYAARSFSGLSGRLRLALQSLGFRRFRVGPALTWIAVLFLAIFAADSLYGALINYFHFHIQTNDQVVLQLSKTAPLTTYATLLAAVVVAPFCEEIFFRSFVFAGMLRAIPVALSILFSALVFGIAHVDPGSFPLLCIIGLALAFLRWRTRSIWPGMILHMLNNGFSALVIVLTMHGLIR